MFCRKCGNEIPDDSEFCPKCGFKVSDISISLTKQDEGSISNVGEINSGINKTDDDLFSEAAREERRRQSAETMRKNNKKKTRINTIIKFTIPVAIITMVFVLFFSLRQFGYTQINGEYYISHYYGSKTKVTIPEKHFGKEVVGVAESAFKDCKVETVIIPYNQSGKFYIEKSAVENCEELSMIGFNDRINEVEICAGAFENCIELSQLNFKGMSFHSLNSIKKAKYYDTSKDDDSLTVEERRVKSSAFIKAVALNGLNWDETAFANCPKFVEE